MSKTAVSQTPEPRWKQTGWILLPLRAFLAVTMIYAGLLKFSDPNFFSVTSPNGITSQMRHSVAGSPVGFIVQHGIEHANLLGLMIAAGEVIVGLGLLFGIFTRLAALGGLALSTSFFLTVSWGTHPYFFGPDIVFMFAFTPLVIGGDDGLLSLEALIRRRVRSRMRLANPAPSHESSAIRAEVNRRTVVQSGVVAAGIGAIGLIVAGVTKAGAGTPESGAGTAVAAPSASGAGAAGSRIVATSKVPVGSVYAFNDAATAAPAFIVHPATDTYLAYSSICTHAGCACGYDSQHDTFVCPCHGSIFNGQSGDVMQGPATTPLAKIPITVSNGYILRA